MGISIKEKLKTAGVVVCVAFGAYWLYATDGCSQPFKLPRFSNGTKDKPVSLPDDALAKLNSKAYPHDGLITLELYNGSDWTLTRVDLEVFKTPKDAPRETRRFRLTAPPSDPAIKPYSTANLEAPVGDFLSGIKDKTEWGFSIPEAFGYKE
jgi:hypothetical protein